jgi:hypothetical protein
MFTKVITVKDYVIIDDFLVSISYIFSVSDLITCSNFNGRMPSNIKTTKVVF